MDTSVSSIPESAEKVGIGEVRSSVHGDATPLKKKVEVVGSGEVRDAAGISLRRSFPTVIRGRRGELRGEVIDMSRGAAIRFTAVSHFDSTVVAGSQTPNKAPEPTPTAVTPRAIE